MVTRGPRRILWLAGTRGEALHLGSLFKRFHAAERALGRASRTEHRLLLTGDQGTPAHQALDSLGLEPHEEFELRHPAEDPALRLNGILEGIERASRRGRAHALVFAGAGPTAMAAALVAHARPCRAIRLRPFDPAGLGARMRWEAGHARAIEALVEPRDTIEIGCAPIELLEGAVPRGGGILVPDFVARASHPCEPTLHGESARPIAIVALGRRQWGWNGMYARLADVVAGWARARPDADFLVVSSLDARQEGPFRSLPDPPPNLVFAPPMGFATWRHLLETRARVVVTDAAGSAADALARGVGVVAVGETETGDPNPSIRTIAALPASLAGEEVEGAFREYLYATDARTPGLGIDAEGPAGVHSMAKVVESMQSCLRD